MKKILICLSVIPLFFAISCKQGSSTAETKSTDTITSIEFENKNYAFGQIVKGQVVEHSYIFKNTGNIDLIIEEVDPSCGCTTPEWT
ncbi:MAG: DUF1573 domain-containing protein [Bacteroidales bacterium]|nr:DUF1573 domain-containing protein [Bacteroidales bacterium]